MKKTIFWLFHTHHIEWGLSYTDRFTWIKWYQQTEWSITNDSRRRNWTKKREICIIFIFVPPNYYGTSYFPSVVNNFLRTITGHFFFPKSKEFLIQGHIIILFIHRAHHLKQRHKWHIWWYHVQLFVDSWTNVLNASNPCSHSHVKRLVVRVLNQIEAKTQCWSESKMCNANWTNRQLLS
jgi:hypothetical protein